MFVFCDYIVLPGTTCVNACVCPVYPEKMRNLFVDLDFNVEVYPNQTSADIKGIMAYYASLNHSASYAFACVIMSHGRLGKIYGVDGRRCEGLVPITEIAECFSNYHCPSLTGKPKLFFIQACQSGAPLGKLVTHYRDS